jgi:hypothetical protein
MESSAFVPSRLKGGMCPADDVTPQRRKPSFIDCADREKKPKP